MKKMMKMKKCRNEEMKKKKRSNLNHSASALFQKRFESLAQENGKVGKHGEGVLAQFVVGLDGQALVPHRHRLMDIGRRCHRTDGDRGDPNDFSGSGAQDQQLRIAL